MPKVAFRQIRTKGVFPDWKQVKREILRIINNKSKPELLAEFEKRVANWKNKPDFVAREFIEPDAIEIRVIPTGENAAIWSYVSGGTRPHPILPRRAKALRFKWDGPGSYAPKTRPGGRYGGPGIARGPFRLFKSVRHPGSAPRNFEKFIARDYKKPFARDMQRATRFGIRQARRKGRGRSGRIA